MADYGFVYCLSNPSMPGIYKVGRTERSPMLRAEQLSSSTSVPTRFNVLFYIECSNHKETERECHEALHEYRVSISREFFNCDPRSIRDFVSEFAREGYLETKTDSWASLLKSIEEEEDMQCMARKSE